MNSDLADDEQSADPAAMLALMQRQQRRTAHWVNRGYAIMLITWASAWIIGFGAIWSATAGGGNPFFRMPTALAWAVFGVALVTGAVVSIVMGIRSGVGVRGPSRLAGAMYGWAWSVSMFGAGLLLGAVQRAGADAEVMAVLSPAVFALLVGVLYLAGGALWRSPVQYALGIVMIATAIGASYAGAPTNYLVYATVGPAAMLVVAILMLRGVLPAEGSR